MNTPENQPPNSQESLETAYSAFCSVLRRARDNRRNGHGVKASRDCYRTIHGNEYQAWTSCPSADRIAAYRKSGIRCRRFGDELFVHVFDLEEAGKLDAVLNLPSDSSSATGAENQKL